MAGNHGSRSRDDTDMTMRGRIGTVAGSLLIVVMGASAHAGLAVAAETRPFVETECYEEMREFHDEVAEDEASRIAVATTRKQLRELTAAAKVLAARGQNDECEKIVDRMEDIVEREREARAKEGAETIEAWSESERARLDRAQPVGTANQSLWASRWLGAEVRNLQNEDLGEVRDLLLDPMSGTSFALVSTEGFLGFGSETVVVPIDRFRIVEGEDLDIVVLDMTEDRLEKAPRFGAESQADWRKASRDYFGGPAE